MSLVWTLFERLCDSTRKPCPPFSVESLLWLVAKSLWHHRSQTLEWFDSPVNSNRQQTWFHSRGFKVACDMDFATIHSIASDRGSGLQLPPGARHSREDLRAAAPRMQASSAFRERIPLVAPLLSGVRSAPPQKRKCFLAQHPQRKGMLFFLF